MSAVEGLKRKRSHESEGKQICYSKSIERKTFVNDGMKSGLCLQERRAYYFQYLAMLP